MNREIKFQQEHLEKWSHRDSYFLEILNGTYLLEDARKDLLSLNPNLLENKE